MAMFIIVISYLFTPIAAVKAENTKGADCSAPFTIIQRGCVA
jgi:hypothetical protein